MQGPQRDGAVFRHSAVGAWFAECASMERLPWMRLMTAMGTLFCMACGGAAEPESTLELGIGGASGDAGTGNVASGPGGTGNLASEPGGTGNVASGSGGNGNAPSCETLDFAGDQSASCIQRADGAEQLPVDVTAEVLGMRAVPTLPCATSTAGVAFDFQLPDEQKVTVYVSMRDLPTNLLTAGETVQFTYRETKDITFYTTTNHSLLISRAEAPVLFFGDAQSFFTLPSPVPEVTDLTVVRGEPVCYVGAMMGCEVWHHALSLSTGGERVELAPFEKKDVGPYVVAVGGNRVNRDNGFCDQKSGVNLTGYTRPNP